MEPIRSSFTLHAFGHPLALPFRPYAVTGADAMPPTRGLFFMERPSISERDRPTAHLTETRADVIGRARAKWIGRNPWQQLLHPTVEVCVPCRPDTRVALGTTPATLTIKGQQMRQRFLGFTFAMVVASAGYAQSAQKPAGGGTPLASHSAGTSVTIEGCVMKEVDVPGRKPPENLRSQAEADDEYVLTSTKMVSGTGTSAPTTSATGGAPTGTSGETSGGPMYDIEGIAKDELRKQVGKRVQIEGVLDHLENAKLPVSFATDLVELKGTTIRSVSGSCPNKE